MCVSFGTFPSVNDYRNDHTVSLFSYISEVARGEDAAPCRITVSAGESDVLKSQMCRSRTGEEQRVIIAQKNNKWRV